MSFPLAELRTCGIGPARTTTDFCALQAPRTINLFFDALGDRMKPWKHLLFDGEGNAAKTDVFGMRERRASEVCSVRRRAFMDGIGINNDPEKRKLEGSTPLLREEKSRSEAGRATARSQVLSLSPSFV